MTLNINLSDLPKTHKEAKALGAKHYFTGKPCKRGHAGARLASSRECLECTAEKRLANPEYAKAYYAANREILLAKSKQYRAANHASLSIRRKAKYMANREVYTARSRAWHSSNRERSREKSRAWAKANRAIASARSKTWRAANPEAYMAQTRAHRKANRQALNARTALYEKRRRASDPAFLAVSRLRCRLNDAIRRDGIRKSATTLELVGCTREHLVAHLENQFLQGMSWNNRSEWHIDHIIPCASFDLTDPAQQRECFHYSNLRPLWAAENRRKSARGIEPLKKGGGYQLTLLVA